MSGERDGRTVPNILQSRAEAQPDGIACYYLDDGNWTPLCWSELWSQVRRTAASFLQRGIQPGDRLAILSSTRFEWQVAEMAAMLVRAVVVGIDAHGTQDYVSHILKSSSARALIVDSAENLAKISADISRNLRFVVLLDQDDETQQEAAVDTWSNLQDHSTEAETSSPYDLDFVEADSAATLIYTSGTTGQPKGIEYTHRQLMAACDAIVDEFHQLNEEDTAICWLPMSALFQRMMNLVAISRGITTYFVDDPRDIIARIGEVQPSLFVGVPRFYEKLYEGIQLELGRLSPWQRTLASMAVESGRRKINGSAEVRPKLKISLGHAIWDRLILRKIRRIMGGRLKFMITGSAPTPTWLLEFFHAIGLPLFEAYGVSENTIPMAANRPDCFRPGSVGKPFAANEIRFAEDGEVLVRGPGVFEGYDRNNRADDRFTREGFYRTGDIGCLDDDGFLFLTGRKSEFIKTSTGRKISPVKVESVLKQSPLLEHVVVVGNGHKYLAALLTISADIEPEEDWETQLAEEIERLNQQLPAHEQVGQFALFPESPSIEGGELTTTLKVRRSLIEDKYQDLIADLFDEDSNSPRCLSTAAATPELAPVP